MSIAVQNLLDGSIPACAGEPRVPELGSRRLSKSGLSPRVRGNQRRSTSLDATHRVYPRVCGGTWCGGSARCWAIGSRGLSPRVRGNRHFDQSPHDLARVYPRVCGGTEPRGQGLSPRVRGKPTGLSRPGSIPACAGEPSFRPKSARPGKGLSPRVRGNRTVNIQPTPVTRVYPRVCGGTDGASSPRAGVYEVRYPRSIPACAGEPTKPRCRV